MSNEDKIGARIEVLKQVMPNKATSELEKGKFEGDEKLLGNGTITGWIDKPISWTSDKLEKFLNHWKINREWWRTGEGKIFDEQSTNDAPEHIYRDLVEARSEYRLIPKSILNEEYRIILKSELDSKENLLNKVIEAQDKLIAQLKTEIADLRSGRIILHAQKTQ